ncbi:MAG: UvrD-helicase domain-containing protein, partial [Ginsengibacter sp.]
MGNQKREPFNALTVPLKGSNLIEASAGTGKTYSIAILVLRLILEENLSIREILMVTFTKAAIAELEERIRIFVRVAYRRSCEEEIEDATISKLVDDSIKRIGKDETTRLLREAVVYLDETSVLTIHSFCQQTLSEFAFETNQVFGTEILQDNSTLLLREVQKFWRKYITVIPAELLGILLDQGLSISSIKTIVKNHLAGKRFQHYDHETEYSLCDEDYKKLKEDLKITAEKLNALETSFEKFLVKNNAELKQRSQKGNAKRFVLPLIDDHEKFLNYINTKRSSKYIADGYQDILAHCDECEKLKEESIKLLQNCVNKIYCLAINQIAEGLNQRKLITGQLSYDDLIENLHRALTHNPNPSLVAALQRKYKAVFVDEFQDTDRFQY